LWRTWENKERAAEALKLTANDMSQLHLIDGILPEPVGGAHANPSAVFSTVKAEIKRCLDELSPLDAQDRINKRIEKFCSMGVIRES
jgi:acetyl-CoA carboxylase carboxyl transferase subunit alpha